MDREEFVDLLEDYAVLMALHGENAFRVRAYQNAARQLRQAELEWFDLAKAGKTFKLPGIGSGILAELREYLALGHLTGRDALDSDTPASLRELLAVPGLGPAKVRAIQQGLGVVSIGELEYACLENRLVDLPGFGAKTQTKLLESLTFIKANAHQRLLADVWDPAQRLRASIAQWEGVIQVCEAGELRRCVETVSTLSFVAACRDGHLPQVPELTSTRIDPAPGGVQVSWQDGLPCILRVVPEACYGAVLAWETGNDGVRDALRDRAQDMGLQFTRDGLFEQGVTVPVPSEADFFERLGLHWVPPERREESSVLLDASQAVPPRLIEDADITGVFHVHTRDSDGEATLDAMAQAARQMGYQYVGISDHSEAAAYARGLTRDRIDGQRHAIGTLNGVMAPFRVLSGIEADILADGELDYDPTTLAGFDFVIGSIHSRYNHSAAETTRRLIRALSNPYLTILGHPTGRLLLSRDSYACDLDAVLQAAARYGKIIELNANPHRLDLDWRHLKRARELGVRIAISPDAHSIGGLSDTRFGVMMARKAGLGPDDIINTRQLADTVAILRACRP